ncbi:MAG: amidohydrolase family protein [Chloroflexi bacterium]|nr:amidohydrolase family protein [Chloroflexota bacterium]
MIIDAHQHLVSGSQLGQYQSGLLNGRGFHGKGNPGINAEMVAGWKQQGKTHIELLDEVGTDVAFLSPRPFTLMHSEKPEKMVHWFAEANNNAIALAVQNEPDRFRGVAGLPQCEGSPVSITFDEIDRCINDLGFIGIMINPDPSEGAHTTPTMGDEYWYPLYEKMVKEDIPALIHPASCKDLRESFHNHFITEESIAILALAQSTVFEDFPNLKLIMSHGGGSIPYQVGRWRARLRGTNGEETFDMHMKRLYYDTCLYSTESLELLFKIVGTDRCLFGTERPGAGSAENPRTGDWYDDTKPLIDEIGFLSDEDRGAIYEGNARNLYGKRYQ